MNIGVLVHFYVPYRNAGSETMLHNMLLHLKKRGHNVKVFTTSMPEAPITYEVDGIPVVSTNMVYAQQFIGEGKPDVLITHHENTQRGARMRRLHGIPFVYVMHNDLPGSPELLDLQPDLVVFNTEWIAKKHRSRVPNSMVLNPPVFASDHWSGTTGNKITLVNLNKDKGGEIFYELASRMPEFEFLGVEGGHGPQIIHEDRHNVEIQRHTTNMRDDVWSKTRLLLMPSVYESYGMAGVEAMASGIPVIANPTPGLRESLGTAGTFIDRNDIHGWEVTIREALKPQNWRDLSAAALARSKSFDPMSDLDRWVDNIERLAV